MAAYDISPLSTGTDLAAYSRDSVQLLVNKLFVLPRNKGDEGTLIALPAEEVFRLPRAKPIPKEKPKTRWDKFMEERNMKKRKRSRLVWDEIEGDWKPRWGYKSAKKSQENANWVHEVGDNENPNENPFDKARSEQRLLKARQKMREVRNKVEAAGGKLRASVPDLDAGQKRGKQGLKEAIKRAQVSSASFGKFDRVAPNEATNLQPKRKKGITPVSAGAEKALVTAVLLERPDDPSFFMLRWLCEQTKSLDGAEQGRTTAGEAGATACFTSDPLCSLCQVARKSNCTALCLTCTDWLPPRQPYYPQCHGAMSGAGEPSLPSLLAEVSELLRSSTLMENKRETIFELLRRSCLKSARDGALDSVSDAAAEDGWYFLLMIRRKSPVRKRRVDECLKALSSSQRWMQRLQTKKLQDFLAQDAESQKLLCGDTAGSNPFANRGERGARVQPQGGCGNAGLLRGLRGSRGRPGTPKRRGRGRSRVGQGVCTAAQKTKEFEQKHQVTARAAGATKASFRAAYEANQKYGVTEKIGQGVTTAAKKSVEFEQRHHVTQRAAEAARSTVNAARGANERYGITEKIGSGAKTAYSKAREFDEKHQVTSKTASGLKSGVSHLASAAGAAAGATSKASKNPFGAPQTPPSPERASAQKNPFRGTGNPFVR
ncbi:unnamed protein product [Effrenium voratum]|nr:unnamed protein product [Effrenium voratum]